MNITRWIWGPTETINNTEYPICREYAVAWFMPYTETPGFGITRCEMTDIMYEAATQDTTIIILPSIHSSQTLAPTVVSSLSIYGITQDTKMADFLIQMGSTCSKVFNPSE